MGEGEGQDVEDLPHLHTTHLHTIIESYFHTLAKEGQESGGKGSLAHGQKAVGAHGGSRRNRGSQV